MDAKNFERVLDAIYDAAALPELWAKALDEIARCFNCSIATLIERNVKTSHGHGVAIGVDEASQLEFFSVWGNRNPFVQALRLKNPSAIDTDRTIIPKDVLLMSDYYNGFMQQRDMHSLLRFTLQKTEDIHQSLSIMGPRSLGDFETAQVDRARLLLPHLKRAGKVTQHLTIATSLMQIVSDAVENHMDGIVILNRSGEIITANRTARAIAASADSLSLRGNQISALHPSANLNLQRLIAASTGKNKNISQARGDVIRLPRSGGGRDYFVAITPLPSAQQLLEKHSPVACVFIRDPEITPSQSADTLKKLFRLTPMETRIVECLTIGKTPEQTAMSLQIGLSTARSHIASIYRKTDVSKQTELLRLLSRIPSKLF